MLPQVRYYAALLQDRQHDVRKPQGNRFADTGRKVADTHDPVGDIDRETVTFANAGGVALNRDEAVVDRVAKERPRKTLRQDGPDPGTEYHRCRHLHRRAAAEVF